MTWRTQRNQRIAALWGKAARDRIGSDMWTRCSWDTHPVVCEYINRRMTGDPNESWLTFVRRRFAPAGLDLGLSIGCGSGGLERDVVGSGLCRTVDGCDISREALAVANDLSARAGFADRIRYFECDLNTCSLAPARYDICFSAAALHHVEDLEHALSEIGAALRGEGLLVLIEYVGPSRYQWSDKVEALMNRLLETLPKTHRTSLTIPDAIRGPLRRPSVDAIAADDPSEAVRAGEIFQQLQRWFELIYRADFGGTLLQFTLADIAGNFRADDPKDRALLEVMILLEETLIDERIIPSDFVFLVARPRESMLRR